jgi:hypothetical protein
MSPRKWIKGIRLLLALLLVPVASLVLLAITVDIVLASLGANPDGPAGIIIGVITLGSGFVAPCVAVLFFGLPYILLQLDQGRLNLRTVMMPTLVFSLLHPAQVYLSFRDLHPPHPLAEAVAAPQILAVFLCGLLFYFVGVWQPRREDA